MKPFDGIEDPRRRLLVEALTLGYMAWGLPLSAHAQIFGSRPAKLPPGQSIFKLGGAVRVNGAAANLQTQIRPGDTVETGSDGEISFVVGEQAMLLRAGYRVGLYTSPHLIRYNERVRVDGRQASDAALAMNCPECATSWHSGQLEGSSVIGKRSRGAA